MITTTQGTRELMLAEAPEGRTVHVTLTVHNADSASATLTATIYDAEGTARVVALATLDIGVPTPIFDNADPCPVRGPERLVIALAAAPTTELTVIYEVR